VRNYRSAVYSSNGPKNTGGYYHEKFWFDQISSFLRKRNPSIKINEIRPLEYEKKGYPAIRGFLTRLFSPSADFIFCPARTALPLLIQAFFTRKTIWVVYHSLHTKALEKDKTKAIFSFLTLFFIRKTPRARLVTVAPFWSNYFTQSLQVPLKKCIELPNLFAPEEYLAYHTLPKKKQIHLGMWSTKIDKQVIELAARLTHKGYFCFFTTPLDIVSISSYGYEICYCPTTDDYRTLVAQSAYTLAFSSIPEGWSRVVHESFLLGTPVIGHDNAGLGDLLRAGNGFFAQTVAEALAIIELNPGWKLPRSFGDKFHPTHAQKYIQHARL
jgi:glycosyltransferase involved in cell wall biosynthesis